MPRLKPPREKQQGASPQPFEYTEAVCVEGFSAGWSEPIQKGRVYPRDHYMVQSFPAFWRLLGPRPDEDA